MAYGFDADRQLVWLAPSAPDSDRMRAGALCRRHADALVVPRGWTLDDRREPAPRLFRVTRADRAATRRQVVVETAVSGDGRADHAPVDRRLRCQR